MIKYYYIIYIVNWCTKASRRKKTGTGRMRYLRRALKRRSNRRQFNGLSPILKKAIINASRETEKRMPTKRSIQKHLRRQKNKISKRRSERKEFIDSLEDEVTKRLQVSQ